MFALNCGSIAISAAAGLFVCCSDVERFWLSPRLKTTVIVVSTATAWPFSLYGLYCHCWTASIAACVSCAGPEITCNCFTFPSAPTTACNTTVPDTFACLAIGGYTGVTMCTSIACITFPPIRKTGDGVALCCPLTALPCCVCATQAVAIPNKQTQQKHTARANTAG